MKTFKKFKGTVVLAVTSFMILGIANSSLKPLKGTKAEESKTLNYVSLGDSMTTGFGFDDYYVDGKDTSFPRTKDENGHRNVRGFLNESSHAYPHKVAEALESAGYEVELTQLAGNAMRVDDYYYAISGEEGDDFYKRVFSGTETGEKWFQYWGPNARAQGLTEETNNIEAVREVLTDSITDADLITLNIGFNNFGTFFTGRLGSMISGLPEGVQGILPNYGDEDTLADTLARIEAPFTAEQLYAYAYELVGTYCGINVAEYETLDFGGLTLHIKDFADLLVNSLVSYCYYFNAFTKVIYELNPDVELIVVGLYNTQKTLNAKLNGTVLPLGKVYDALIETANLYTGVFAEKAGEYQFVDLSDEDVELHFDNMASGDLNADQLNRIAESFPALASFAGQELKLDTATIKLLLTCQQADVPQGAEMAYGLLNGLLGSVKAACAQEIIDLDSALTTFVAGEIDPLNLSPIYGLLNLYVRMVFCNGMWMHPSEAGYSLIANKIVATLSSEEKVSAREYMLGKLANIAEGEFVKYYPVLRALVESKAIEYYETVLKGEIEKAVAAGKVLAAKGLEEALNATKELVGIVKDFVLDTALVVIEFVDNTTKTVVAFVDRTTRTVYGYIDSAVSTVRGFVESTKARIVGFVDSTVRTIKSVVDCATRKVLNVVTTTVNTAKAYVENILNRVCAQIAIVKAKVAEAINTAKEVIYTVNQTILTVKATVDALEILVKGLVASVEGFVENPDVPSMGTYEVNCGTYYLSLGDSTMTGMGLGADIDGKDWNAGIGQTVEEAYPQVLASLLGISKENHRTLGMGGIRVQDLHQILDLTAPTDDYFESTFVNGYFKNYTAYGDSREAVNATFVSEIEKADFITVSIGGNAVSQYLAGQMKSILANGTFAFDVDWSKYLNNPLAAKAIELLAGPASKLQAYLVSELGNNVKAVEMICEAAVYGALEFINDYAVAFDDIHNINPEAMLAIVGLYTPWNNVVYEDGKVSIDVNKVLSVLSGVINYLYLSYSLSHANTMFVSCPSVEIFADVDPNCPGTNLANPVVFNYLTAGRGLPGHPTANGHEAVANAIASLLTGTTEHVYGEATYEWSEDYSTCTAKVVCDVDGDIVEETVNTSKTVTTERAYLVNELSTFTAKFDNKLFEEQVKEGIKTADAMGYDELEWSKVEYTWNADFTKCVATRSALNADLEETEEAVAVKTVTQEKAYLKDEISTFTATFDNEAFDTQVKEGIKTADALTYADLTWTKATYTWNADNTKVTATRSATNADLTETEEADVTTQVVQAQGYKQVELTKYTATFENTAFATQTKTLQTKEALPYDEKSGSYTAEFSKEEISSGKGAKVDDIFEAAKEANKPVVIELENGATITFDNSAVSSIAGGNNVTLKANISSSSAPFGSGMTTKVVLDITLNGATFANGSVTVSVPYTEEAAEGTVLKVYYVNGEELVDMEAVFANGKVTFTTNHFSKYIIVEEEVSHPIPALGIVGIVLGGLVLVYLISYAVAYKKFFKGKKIAVIYKPLAKLCEKKETEETEEVKE